MGTICIHSLFFYGICRSRNPPKLLYCFAAASLKIAGSGVTSQRQFIPASHNSVHSGISTQFTCMVWKHIGSYQGMLFPHISGFGYFKVCSFLSYNKISKPQPNNATNQHPQNSVLALFLFPHSDSCDILTDFAMTLLVHSFFLSHLRHPGQFLMVSIAQMSTNIGDSELRAEEQKRLKQNKLETDLYSLGYLCNGSMDKKNFF